MIINKKIITILLILLFLSSTFNGVAIDIKSNFEENLIFNKNNENDLCLIKGRTYYLLYSKEDVDNFNVVFSIPINYINHAPVYLKILDNSTANIISYKIENDTFSPNKLINFTIGHINKKVRTELNFEYWTLIKNSSYPDLPEDIVFPNESNIPEEAKLWATPSECVQSDNIIITLKAKQFLKESNGDLLSFIDKAINFVKYKRADYWPDKHTPKLRFYLLNAGIPNLLRLLRPNKYTYFREIYITGLGQQNGPFNLIIAQPMYYDALSVFFGGGNCAGQANLAAALFRSVGIPSRILFCEPNSNAICHFIIDFYIPEYGWVKTDQSIALNFVPSKKRLILRLCSPEDENIAGHGLKKYGGLIQTIFINHDKIFGEERRRRNFNEDVNISVDIEQANEILNITQDVWDLFTQFSGRDLGEINNQHIINATIAQQDAIKCFNLEDINGFFTNITHAYNEYKKIDTS